MKEINREKVTLFQKTNDTVQCNLLDDLNNATEETKKEYNYYNCCKRGFLHDYDYEAMGY